MFRPRYNNLYTEDKIITEKYILDKKDNLIVSDDELNGINKYIFDSFEKVFKAMDDNQYYVYSIYNVGNESYISLGARDNCKYILSKRDLMIRDNKFKVGDRYGK